MLYKDNNITTAPPFVVKKIRTTEMHINEKKTKTNTEIGANMINMGLIQRTCTMLQPSQ